MDPAVATALDDLHVEFHQASSDIHPNLGPIRIVDARARLIETYAIAVERILKAAQVDSPKKPSLDLTSNLTDVQTGHGRESREANRSAWLRSQARAAGYTT